MLFYLSAFVICQGIQNGNMNLQQSDICEITPVSLACLKGRLDMVELLLEKGANINYNNEVRWSLCMNGKYSHCFLSG